MKNSNYEIATQWVAPYFYLIKQLNQKEKLQRKFEEILEIKSEGIEEVKNSEFKIEWTKYEKKRGNQRDKTTNKTFESRV